MAKIDVTQIEGYENMTPEEKLKALEMFDIPEPDYSGYVKKELFDKTASELADKKKQLKDKMTEDEQKAQKEKEERDELEAKYSKLLRESDISKHKAKLLAQGYEETLAEETAAAMTDGDFEKVFINQQKHLSAFEKKVRAEALKNVPKPGADSEQNGMTLDKFRKLSPLERLAFSEKHPDEYKEIYNIQKGGN